MSEEIVRPVVVVNNTEAPDPRDRPGIRTTEFWLALIVAVGGVLQATYSDKPWAQVAGIVAAALVSMGYGAARAKVKL